MGKIEALQCGTLCCAAPYTISETGELTSDNLKVWHPRCVRSII